MRSIAGSVRGTDTAESAARIAPKDAADGRTSRATGTVVGGLAVAALPVRSRRGAACADAADPRSPLAAPPSGSAVRLDGAVCGASARTLGVSR